MSYKRKTTSLSQSSGSDLSDAGKELELLANKKPKKSYAYTRYLKGKILFFFLFLSDESKTSSKSVSRSKSRSGSGSDSGTARSRSASRSRVRIISLNLGQMSCSVRV